MCIYIYLELQSKLQLRCVDIAHGYGLIWNMQRLYSLYHNEPSDTSACLKLLFILCVLCTCDRILTYYLKLFQH